MFCGPESHATWPSPNELLIPTVLLTRPVTNSYTEARPAAWLGSKSLLVGTKTGRHILQIMVLHQTPVVIGEIHYPISEEHTLQEAHSEFQTPRIVQRGTKEARLDDLE